MAAKAEAKETRMPEPEDMAVPSAIMSEDQKRIFQAVKTAGMPRVFDSVEDLAPRLVMQVPETFTKRYPERDYGWADGNDLAATIHESGGMWAVANRSNHSDIPNEYWDSATGGHLYKGQNVLVFRHRSTKDLLEKKNILQFAQLEKKNLQGMAQKFSDGGIEVGRLEQVRDPGDGYGVTDLEPSANYDFGAPSEGE